MKNVCRFQRFIYLCFVIVIQQPHKTEQMTTLEKIKAHPKCNSWGSLGSRNRNPFLLKEPIMLFGDEIIMVDANCLIVRTTKGFNETMYWELVPQVIQSAIYRQLNAA